MKYCVSSYKTKQELSLHRITLWGPLCPPKPLTLDQSLVATRKDEIITKYRLCVCRRNGGLTTLKSSELHSLAKTTDYKEYSVTEKYYTNR